MEGGAKKQERHEREIMFEPIKDKKSKVTFAQFILLSIGRFKQQRRRRLQKRHLKSVFELFQVTCKRTQQLPTTLGPVGQQCCNRLHGAKSLTGFKLCATTSNNTQQHATGCANGRNMKHPTIRFSFCLSCVSYTFFSYLEQLFL